ncbi:MAG: YkgJ family cysteine cluster protein [Nitrospirae bacterium]|nr:YkgJ family cysteine cluster protein [Candidatus Troglogloeales bacterium]
MELPSLPTSETCLSCRGCCIFLSSDSPWIPYFRSEEIKQAIEAGVSPDAFSSTQGSHIIPVSLFRESHKSAPLWQLATPYGASSGDRVCCPALDPKTHHCMIYDVRPLDCFIYPFVLMWDSDQTVIFLALHEACPFVLSQTIPLPEVLVCRAAELTQMLQTPQMIESLSAHPGMIMLTQHDTMLMAPLDRLTQALTNPGQSQIPR